MNHSWHRGTHRGRGEIEDTSYDEGGGRGRRRGRSAGGRQEENLGYAERVAADDSAAMAISSVDIGGGFLGSAWRHLSGRFRGIACAGGGESFADGARGDAFPGTEGRGGSGHQRFTQGSRPAADRIREVGEIIAGAVFQPPL